MFKKIALLLCLSFCATALHAALLGRLPDNDGNFQAYYDEDADLTWLADASYLGTTGWSGANYYATTININGVTGWRMPVTNRFDSSCSEQGSFSYGYNCTGSELGNMFYNVLGGVAGSSIETTHNDNYYLFSNIQSSDYWSATEYPLNSTDVAWYFRFRFGYQDGHPKRSNIYAWAVHNGDVGSVPIPAAAWLFGSGLIGLMGLARRKHALSNMRTH